MLENVLLYTYRDLLTKKHRDKNSFFLLLKRTDWSYYMTFFFYLRKKTRVYALIAYIIVLTSEQNRVTRLPLLLSDNYHVSLEK